MITATAGRWDPKDYPTYFVAASIGTLVTAAEHCSHVLMAINEFKSPKDAEHLELFLRKGANVLIDSGVFWLSTQHAKKFDLRMDQALSLAPTEVDNFDWLYANYVKILKQHGDRVWGYIEIDQGGRENKIKTRAKLETQGLRPIPVYHPFNDGWDYFDFLAKRYDRICFGNVVQADPATRKRLMATAWERRRKYPNLWIHMLGLTPNERAASYPLPSCDSSTWIGGVRWDVHNAMVANRRCWSTGSGLVYDTQAKDTVGPAAGKAINLAAYEAEILRRTMRTMADESRKALGCDPMDAIR